RSAGRWLSAQARQADLTPHAEAEPLVEALRPVLGLDVEHRTPPLAQRLVHQHPHQPGGVAAPGVRRIGADGADLGPAGQAQALATSARRSANAAGEGSPTADSGETALG